MELELTKPIIQIVQDGRDINYAWEDGAEKLDNHNIQVVSISDYPSLVSEGKYLVPKLVKVGDVLVEDRYIPNKYIDISTAETELLQEKALAMSSIINQLGFKHYEVEVILDAEEKANIEANGNLSYKAVDLKPEYKNKVENSYKNRFSLKDTFSGKAINQEEAIRIAQQFGLWDNMDVRTLIENRDPNNPNIQTSRILNIEITKELNRTKEMAVSLNVLAGLFSLSASTKNSINTKQSLIFKYTIE